MIHETNDAFPFSKLILCKPISTTAGSFFIRYSLHEHPLYIQPPKCYIKQIHTKTGKKMYADLVFQQENEAFIRWMENLENHTQQLLYDHRQQWFQSDLEKEDIEQSFASPMKVYKSGKEYIIRTNIASNSGKSKLKIYNEEEVPIPIEEITENTNVMVILEIQGVRSSTRSFQIDIEIKQMMVLKPEEIFNSCIFKKKVGDTEPLVKKEMEPEPETETITYVKGMDLILDKDEKNNIPASQIEDESTPSILSASDPLPVLSASDPLPIETELCEVDIHLDEVSKNETVSLKERKELYYKMYEEARQKAKVARDLALSSYLEAKQIKNKYMLDDILNSSSSSEDTDESDNDE
jgi:hypothetical protein